MKITKEDDEGCIWYYHCYYYYQLSIKYKVQSYVSTIQVTCGNMFYNKPRTEAYTSNLHKDKIYSPSSQA